MRNIITSFFFLLTGLLIAGTAATQVTVTNPTNTTPNLAATYTSLANAITALNTITAISGPVTITLNAGNPQTAPSGGYIINFTATTSAVNNVIITGSSNTITAFTPQPTGSVIDAIFKIQGANFVTIQNFTMQENPANTTTGGATPTNITTGNNMTEWGVALLYRNNTDGSQNNTIQNNNISLNRTYTNTYGIYSSVRHSPTAPTVTADIINATTAPNSGNKIYGNNISNVNMGVTMVGSAVAAQMDSGNDVGGSSPATGNVITNWGSTGPAITVNINSSGTYHGIFMNHQVSDNVSYNTITSATLSSTTSDIHGIYKRYASGAPTGTFTSNITNNTITVTNNLAGTSDFRLIYSVGITTASVATLNINNNTLLNLSVGAAGSANSIVGIYNVSVVSVLNMNGNTIRGCTSTATSGGFTGIINNGSVYTTLNINNNNIGSAAGNAISFSAATSGAVNGIACATVNPTASVSISNNNFQGFVNSIAGSGIHTYISIVHSPSGASTNNINNNTFTNLVSNTTSNVTLINRSGIMALNAGHTDNCNNNSIVTAYSKPSGTGVFNGYNSSSGSFSGNTMNQESNNFSNISIAGGVVNIWNNTEGGGTIPVKNINNNTFNNINYTGITNINVINISRPGGTSSISGNTINNVTANGLLNCITFSGTIAATALNVLSNTVTNCSSTIGITGIRASATSITTLNVNNNIVGDLYTSSSAASGITFTGGITVNAFKNKVYGISADDVSPQVFGISVAVLSTGNYNIHNNYIGNLSAPNASLPLAVYGLSILPNTASTTHTVYYNTVYLNTASIGTDFGSTALYLLASSTSSTCNTTLRNNILINTSVPQGTGLTTSIRRTATTLNNFNSASNNNIFYTGTPAANRLIYFDGTNSDQTLTAYKTRVSPRDAGSFTELCPFISTTGTALNFLHLNPAVPTQAESGAVNITGITTDYDNDIREGNPGYTGTGTAPDIGADEMEGIFTELNPPVVTYTSISTPTCTYTNITITGVNITDATGIPLSGANRPRIYYQRNSGSWFSQPGTNTAGTSTNSTWSFTIVASDMGTLTGGDVISYYIIAQDNITTANVASNPAAGLVATSVNSVTTAPTSPNTYTLLYNLSGTYTVGTSGHFPTLTAAVAAYNNACSLAGATVFELIDDTYTSETYPIAINNHADASAVNTLTIRPSATAVPVFTNTANTIAFNLNGARFIRFDGRQGGVGTGRSLTLSNTGGGITMQFINDAQNNLVRNCLIKGQRVSAFSGTIFFSTAGSGTGNDNNSIDNNEINEAGGFSNNAIYSSGTAFNGNDNISIINNLISNYFNATNDCHGIFINTTNSASGWTISNNRFFQSATRTFTGNVNYYGIRIASGSGYTISNNTIGFADASGTGMMALVGNSVALTGFPTSYSVTGTATLLRFLGIAGDFNLLGTTSAIDGNTIGGIAMYTSGASSAFGQFCGVYIENGPVNIGNNAGNTVGSTTAQRSVYFVSANASIQGVLFGMRVVSIGTSLVQNNVVGGILVSGNTNAKQVTFTGFSLGGPSSYTVSNNQVGNASPDNIEMGFATTAGLLSINGTLEAATLGSTSPCTGITMTASGNSVMISQNVLQGWTIAQSNTSVIGITCGSGLSGLNPSLSAINNNLGSVSAGWVRYKSVNTAFTTLNGIYLFTTNVATSNISGNEIRGVTYDNAANNTGFANLLYSSSGAIANGISTISNNTFTNLRMQQFTFFIEAGVTMNATAQRFIQNNKTVGSTVITNGFRAIDMIGGSVSGSQLTVTDNNFSDIVFDNTLNTAWAGASYVYFDREGSATPGIHPTKKIARNTFKNITGTGGTLDVLHLNRFGSVSATDSVAGNNISDISITNGNLTAISLGAASISSSNEISIYENQLSDLFVTGPGVELRGFHAGNTGGSVVTNFQKNELHGFSATGSDASCIGVLLTNQAANIVIKANKLYDIEGDGTNASAHGVNIGLLPGSGTGISQAAVYNNLIGDIKTPVSGNAALPLLAGIIVRDGNQLHIHNNSIYLTASGSDANFSSAGLYTNVSSQIFVYNNILCNLSVPGASGRTVAHWRESNDLTNIDANNNDVYAGTASSTRLLYYDATNSSQTLAAYQAAVTPDESASVSELPVFLSTTPSNALYLHINPLLNCSLAGRGTNQIANIADDYDGEARMTSSPWIIDIGADEASKLNVWTGAINSNWNNAGNWSRGIIPNANDQQVLITNPPAVQPTIAAGDVFQMANLIIEPGALLTNRGTIRVNGGIFAPAASINNIQAGIVEGSVEMNGNCSAEQFLKGDVFVANSVNNFIVANSLFISAVTSEHLKICGTLSFTGTGKTLTTADNIILASSQNATANIADVTGNLIAGGATVERYINTGVGGGRHPKSWQFLATPVGGQTIFQSWQESGATPAGFGTIITGTGTGFDITTAQPSMKAFNPSIGANGDWVGVNNTGSSLQDQRGYMIFVRGDRTVTTVGAAANPTVLRAKGSLYQPSNPPPVTNVLAGKLASVGNPFASSINLEYMRDNGLFVNLNNDAVVWDPLLFGSYGLGGYQTLAAANDYKPTAGGTAFYPAGVSAPDIQSGQAFFVRSSGLAGTVSFNEACKLSGSRLVNRVSQRPGDRQFFRATILTVNNVLADGNAVVFSNSYRNRVDEDDAVKLPNAGENFSIVKLNTELSVEARKRIERNDTVFYSVKNLRKQTYHFVFAPERMNDGRLEAYLVDNYLHTRTSISLQDSSLVSFTVNNNPASANEHRFYVVFRKRIRQPLLITLQHEGKSPAEAELFSWKVENEEDVLAYELQTSTNASIFGKILEQHTVNNNSVLSIYKAASTIPVHEAPYYRVAAKLMSGEVIYSNVVKLEKPLDGQGISVSPNPVENKTIHINFASAAPGNQLIEVFNAAGLLVVQKTMAHYTIDQKYLIALPVGTSAGNYLIKIRSAAGTVTSIPIVIK